MEGCEWDEMQKETSGYVQYGYNGESFIALDLKNLIWIALNPQAVSIKQKWDTDNDRIKDKLKYVTEIYPQWMKMYLKYGNTSVLTPGKVT